MKVVANSTPLIALARIKQVDLLRAIFGRIIIWNRMGSALLKG